MNLSGGGLPPDEYSPNIDDAQPPKWQPGMPTRLHRFALVLAAIAFIVMVAKAASAEPPYGGNSLLTAAFDAAATYFLVWFTWMGLRVIRTILDA